MAAEFKYDVFVSYNRQDASLVRALVAVLERAGLRCFQDVSRLRIYDKLDASLKAAIAQSRYVLAIVSPSYLRSYWCMFEAMEAIQGQALDIRFLPIVVKYRPSDASLDETFVLKALEALDEEMRSLESQIVRLKVYDLNDKLERLNFVRRRLPMIYRTIYERVFPEFLLWDDAQIPRTVEQLLTMLAPEATFASEDLQLAFEHAPDTGAVLPRINDVPVIGWKAYVGRQAWKNSPVVVGSNVYIGTAGDDWNSPDGKDGVYCLEAETGKLRWFARTSADANQVLVTKGRVVTGCDDGSVAAFAADDGRQLWSLMLESGVVGGPVALNGSGGVSMANQRGRVDDPVLVVTYDGMAAVLDVASGRLLSQLSLGRTVIGGVTVYERDRQQFVAIPTVEGELITLGHGERESSLMILSIVKVPEASLAARPTYAAGKILLGLVDGGPTRLAAVDAATGEFSWPTTLDHYLHATLGNVRGAPVVVGEDVVFAPAYSDGIRALDWRTGKFAWQLRLGQEMFEQWSGPIVHGSMIYLGRHDGYVHKIDVRTRQRLWSMYVGEAETAGAVASEDQALPEFASSSAWRSGASWPILATPCIDRGRLYIGTHEGYLFCIRNLGGDS